MKALENLGVRPGNDEHHGLMAAEVMSAEHFFRQSNEWLEQVAPHILEEVTPGLEEYPGRWNPGGFMVFPLGIHELGSVRLHVYPAGLRETSQGPNIHNHAWHLSSRVLAGNYTDTIYDLEDREDDPGSGHELFGLYNTSRKPGGLDSLVGTGRIVEAVSAKEREFSAGQIHNIDAGVYHLTTIPDDMLAATLVLDSPAFINTTGVLLKSRQPEIARRRLAVEATDVLTAKQQLLDIL